MQTLFDIKTRLPIDVDVFEEMRKMAEAELSSNTEAGKYTQAVVLLSAKGNKYRVRIQNALSEEKEQETSLFERMRNLNDTEIYYVLCMWQDKHIDIPSYSFRELIRTLNPKNTETLLFVMAADGVSGIKVSATVK